jgi:hypothetical protein
MGAVLGTINFCLLQFILYVTRFRTYTIICAPQNKNLGGEWASNRRTAAFELLLQITFKTKEIQHCIL